MMRRWIGNAVVAVLGGTALGCTAPPPLDRAKDATPSESAARHGGHDPATAATAMRSHTPGAPARDAAAELVIAAMNFLGQPYRAGGQSVDSGFDCSGFTRHLFGHTLGIELPRRVDEQANDPALSQVSRDTLRAGDLVFFNTLRRTFSHVGIYVGDGRFIHAPRSGAQIRVESLSASYWSRRYTGARRAVVLADTSTP